MHGIGGEVEPARPDYGAAFDANLREQGRIAQVREYASERSHHEAREIDEAFCFIVETHFQTIVGGAVARRARATAPPGSLQGRDLLRLLFGFA